MRIVDALEYTVIIIMSLLIILFAVLKPFPTHTAVILACLMTQSATAPAVPSQWTYRDLLGGIVPKQLNLFANRGITPINLLVKNLLVPYKLHMIQPGNTPPPAPTGWTYRDLLGGVAIDTAEQGTANNQNRPLTVVIPQEKDRPIKKRKRERAEEELSSKRRKLLPKQKLSTLESAEAETSGQAVKIWSHNINGKHKTNIAASADEAHRAGVDGRILQETKKKQGE